MVDSIMMEFVNEIRRKSRNVTHRNQMSFNVSLDDVRMSEPLRQHSANLQQHTTGAVKTPTDPCEGVRDVGTFGTGLLSNPPRTANPGSLFSGVPASVVASCFS